MKAIAFIIGLSAVMLHSCTDNLNEILPDSGRVVLTGNKCEAPRAASTELPSYLPAGSPILVNATGGLTLANEVLTYRNQRWETEIPLRLDRPATPTRLTALYPAQDPSHYTAAHLYAGGRLTDVLYAQHTFQPGDRFHLQFKHLFAQLSLNLAPVLQDGLQRLEITCPHSIASIDAATATLTLAPGKPHTTVCLPRTAGQRYTLLVPPGNTTTFTLRLVTAKRTFATTLTVARLESGHTYAYTLQPQKPVQEQGPGIATVEDWIAFGQLMENPSLDSYKGKTLQDFGKMVNGVPTYYLLNDLDFSQVDPHTDLAIFEYRKAAQGLQGVFDGQGHTLSNLTVFSKEGGLGIFIGISTKGCLKNLRVKNCTAILRKTDTSYSQGIGILTGYNNGTIQNCQLIDCQLQAYMNRTYVPSGALTGTCTGTILNSSIQQVTIRCQAKRAQKPAAGGLAGQLEDGQIFNCYAAHVRVDWNRGINGGLCGELKNAKLFNCYIYRAQLPNNQSGILCGSIDSQSIVKFNYYEASAQTKFTANKEPVNPKNVEYNKTYDASFVIEDYPNQPFEAILNRWIKNKGKVFYPEYHFTPWTDGGTALPAVWANPNE